MLATPWPAPFDDEDWWFELKWDGYRCVARAERSGLRMWSRRGLDLGDRFHEVAALRLPEGWVFDGEVIAFDEAGRPDFQLLQAGEPATYVIFDVLESNQNMERLVVDLRRLLPHDWITPGRHDITMPRLQELEFKVALPGSSSIAFFSERW